MMIKAIAIDDLQKKKKQKKKKERKQKDKNSKLRMINLKNFVLLWKKANAKH